MRRRVIAGNWKMNKDIDESTTLTRQLLDLHTMPLGGVEVVICPPFPSLHTVSTMVKNSPIAVGGQNMSHEDDGAFTGEVSGRMLKGAGCTHVILGHSERRQLMGESNALVNAKLKKALAVGLTPIVCVGETLQEREKEITKQVVSQQIRESLVGIKEEELPRCIIAYEPVWAIGTGKTASPEQAEEVHHLIRSLLGELSSHSTAEKVVLQYGGSVKPDNAATLLNQPNIDGALVGGACLQADSFVQIIKSATAKR